MKERPMIMTAESVRAILAGTKTQTRRVITVPWRKGKRVQPYEPYWNEVDGRLFYADEYGDWHPVESTCPHGQPGDRLWLRETWRFVSWNWDDSEAQIEYGDGTRHWWQTPEDDINDRWTDWLIKQSDNWAKLPGVTFHEDEGDCGVYYIADESVIPWRSPLFMPRWASRITLEIVNVRAERLFDITENDAKAEGVSIDDTRTLTYRGAFAITWDAINKKRGYGWDGGINPWVWVVEFKQVTA